MLASKSRLQIAYRAVLIAVILFNALAPIAASAISLSEGKPYETDTWTGNNSSVENIPAYSEEIEQQTRTLPPELRDLALATATPLASEAVSPEDLASESPTISLAANPDSVTAESSLILNWEIKGIVLADHKLLSVQMILPEGYSLAEKYEGAYDESTRTLTIPITTALSGQVNLLTNASVTDSKIPAFLLEDTEILAETVLFLPVHEQFVLDQQGGSVAASGGEIQIEFPANALSGEAVIEVGVPSEETMPPYSLSGQPFEIKAHEKQSGDPLNQFSKKISIRVSYADRGIPEELEGDLYLH